MITTEGKIYIKRYLAGWVPSIASSMAFGVGDKAEAVGDLKLQFEIGRADIALTSYDFVNNKLVFKAALPDDFTGTIREIGLFSRETNALAGDYGSELISTFESDTEDWFNPVDATAATYSTANTRIGDNSVRLSPTASTSARSRLDDIFLDFSGNSSGDKFVMAANIGSNVASVGLRMMTDASNYYSFTFTPAAGYQVFSATLGSATLTGAPKWDTITMIEVLATATAGGAATVDYDGLRIEDTDTPNPEYVMVSRELLATPFIKEGGRQQAIEFALDVAI